jgi:hypothetical protein
VSFSSIDRAIVSANGKEHFLKQLLSIVDSVQQNRTKIERRQQDEKSQRDTLKTRLAQLIDKSRQYAKVLKDFQEVNRLDKNFIDNIDAQVIRENEYLTSKSK